VCCAELGTELIELRQFPSVPHSAAIIHIVHKSSGLSVRNPAPARIVE